MGQNWKYNTPQPSDHLDTDRNRQDGAEPYEIVYLVKRATYEFRFAVPRTPSALHKSQRAFFEMHWRNRPEDEGFVLDLDALEDFYEGLSRLMEYIEIERLRSGGMC